jgi:mannosyltransferase OCH1-like enzyme
MWSVALRPSRLHTTIPVSDQEEWPTVDDDDEKDKQRRPRILCGKGRVNTVAILVFLFLLWVVFGLCAYFYNIQQQLHLQHMEAMAVRVDTIFELQQPQKRSVMSEEDPSSTVAAARDWKPLDAGQFPIPRVLHQSWPTREVPAQLMKYVSTWRRIQPAWGYQLHTNEDNDALVAAHCTSPAVP